MHRLARCANDGRASQGLRVSCSGGSSRREPPRGCMPGHSWIYVRSAHPRLRLSGGRRRLEPVWHEVHERPGTVMFPRRGLPHRGWSHWPCCGRNWLHASPFERRVCSSSVHASEPTGSADGIRLMRSRWGSLCGGGAQSPFSPRNAEDPSTRPAGRVDGCGGQLGTGAPPTIVSYFCDATRCASMRRFSSGAMNASRAMAPIAQAASAANETPQP